MNSLKVSLSLCFNSPSSLAAAFSVPLIRLIIWEIAPCRRTASILIPLYKLRLPKVKRVTPLTESMPTDAIRIPKQPLMIPFNRLSPLTEAITESPKIASAKYSGAPKFIAIFPICGAKNNSQHALIRPPTVEAVKAVLRAFPGKPFRQQGYPSKSVAAAALSTWCVNQNRADGTSKIRSKKDSCQQKECRYWLQHKGKRKEYRNCQISVHSRNGAENNSTNIPRFIIIRFSIVSRFFIKA